MRKEKGQTETSITSRPIINQSQRRTTYRHSAGVSDGFWVFYRVNKTQGGLSFSVQKNTQPMLIAWCPIFPLYCIFRRLLFKFAFFVFYFLQYAVTEPAKMLRCVVLLGKRREERQGEDERPERGGQTNNHKKEPILN